MDIIEFAERLSKLDPARVLRDILSNVAVQQFIIDLNTKEQLFKGYNSLGVKLSDIGGDYSITTQLIKGVTDPSKVTLYDDGDYYASYDVEPLNNGDFEITSDPFKDGVSLEDRWGDELEGLNDENLKKLDEFLEEKIAEYIQALL